MSSNVWRISSFFNKTKKREKQTLSYVSHKFQSFSWKQIVNVVPLIKHKCQISSDKGQLTSDKGQLTSDKCQLTSIEKYQHYNTSDTGPHTCGKCKHTKDKCQHTCNKCQHASHKWQEVRYMYWK